MASSKLLERYCLVTVGATVGFLQLTKEILQPKFWQYLTSKGFTSLHVQCGPDATWAKERIASLQDEVPTNLIINVFESRKNLMEEEMVLCRAQDGVRAHGLVISHAGTGTILDAWKIGLSIIVVPNKQLLDDHQTEMAKHLAQEGYATMSTTSRQDLEEAIHKAELLWQDNKARWPPNNIKVQSNAKLRLWEITPSEVVKEDNTQMAHD